MERIERNPETGARDTVGSDDPKEDCPLVNYFKQKNAMKKGVETAEPITTNMELQIFLQKPNLHDRHRHSSPMSCEGLSISNVLTSFLELLEPVVNFLKGRKSIFNWKMTNA
jgi:hypothetical protein